MACEAMPRISAAHDFGHVENADRNAGTAPRASRPIVQPIFQEDGQFM